MKKLLFLSFIFLCLIGWSPRAEYYNLLHKKVEIQTMQNKYVGVLDEIIEEGYCMRSTPFGVCYDWYNFITLYIIQGKQTKVIRAESIVSIKEIK